jgi:hypothetical protein
MQSDPMMELVVQSTFEQSEEAVKDSPMILKVGIL